MMKGDKIKLKKGIGTLRHIGAICEVTDVSEDGIISFRYKNKYEGCISEDVCAEYFDEVHKWSEWRKKNGGNYFNSDGRCYVFVFYKSMRIISNLMKIKFQRQEKPYIVASR